MALALMAAPTASLLACRSAQQGDRVGVIVPGLNAVVGTRPVLHGTASGTGPVTVRVYRSHGQAEPVISGTAHLAGTSWSLPATLAPGDYRLVVEQSAQRSARTFTVSSDPVIAAAGDIACDPKDESFYEGVGSPSGKNCQEQATSDLMVGAGLTAVLAIGDEQYESAQRSAFARSFDPTWGRLKRLIHPALGNHEYQRPNPTAAYYDYFGGRTAGGRGKGWYSFDIGSWHLIALNSNCQFLDSCGKHSAEVEWLKADLRAHRDRCTLAYWHHPRFSSGKHRDYRGMSLAWQALQEARADVVLVAHDHDYERFAPQTDDGVRDDDNGIREFVVGTGGRSHDPFRTVEPASERRNAVTYGVLDLVLKADRYDWRFVPVAGGTQFTDAGTTRCH